MIDVAILVGTTRPGRRSRGVAEWVYARASTRGDARFAIVDLAEVGLPFYDEPRPASQGDYQHGHTRRWSAMIVPFDAFVIVTAEYNHGVPAVLKNALDSLYAEWNDKAVGFVSYGSAGGVRAVEHLRGIVGELRMADVRAQVYLSTATEVSPSGEVHPEPPKESALDALLDQVVAWGEALAAVRAGRRRRTE
jgi:NAD(P)H-dependent FMN reductase